MVFTHVGANNLTLLLATSSFGSRLCGGKKAADADYLNTRCSPIIPSIFKKEDLDNIPYVIRDGKRLVPKHYAPVINLLLVNGCFGIGVGYRTSIPNFNPEDLVKNTRLLLDGQPQEPLCPWYNNFTGLIDWLDEKVNI